MSSFDHEDEDLEDLKKNKQSNTFSNTTHIAKKISFPKILVELFLVVPSFVKWKIQLMSFADGWPKYSWNIGTV